MTTLEAIRARHSVRSYQNKPIPDEEIGALRAEADACNRESGLHIQLVTNDPAAFDGFMAHYGKFSGVRNYIALIGKDNAELDEKLGYYGERLALLAQCMGLNTCWVAMSFSKGAVKKTCDIAPGEKLVCVLSLGFGATNGIQHPSKPLNALYTADGDVPDWFLAGIEAASLAPTAVNQQKFHFTLAGKNKVRLENLGGFYSKVDLGIVKYNFEAGAGKENFEWEK